MKKHKKRYNNHSNQNGKSRLRPPYFINKNLQFIVVRNQMKMKTDGPTLNEMSSIDTTGNVGVEDLHQSATTRPVNTSTKIKNWWKDNTRQIAISVLCTIITSVIIYVFGNLVHHHDIRLTEHDKDIEYIMKNDTKQDDEIEKLNNKTQVINTDVRLIEQRIELTLGKSENSKPSNKNN